MNSNVKGINFSFQYLRSRRLNLKIVAYEQAILDRDLFLNLGLVQNLSLDLSDHLMIPKPLVVLRYLHTFSFKESMLLPKITLS